jgi:hypothetical protein
MVIDGSPQNPAGSPASGRGANMPAFPGPDAPARDCGQAGRRPTVNLRSATHPQVVHTAPATNPVDRAVTVPRKRASLFQRPWVHDTPRASPTKRRDRERSSAPWPRPTPRAQRIVPLAPRPGGPLVFVRITCLYDRLMSQLRRSRRRRLIPQPARTTGREKEWNLPSAQASPRVHWDAQSPGFRSSSITSGGGEGNGRMATSGRKLAWPTTKWGQHQNGSLVASRTRPIDHRLAEKAGWPSFKTCRVRPARRNKSRKPGRAE